MTQLKTKLLGLKEIVTTGVGMGLFYVNTAMAQSSGSGSNSFISPTDAPGRVSQATNGAGSLRELVLTIVNFFLGFLGLVAVLMIIYGGFLYMTSGINAEGAKKGKTILTMSILGIMIILLSFAIVNTIFSAGSGQSA